MPRSGEISPVWGADPYNVIGRRTLIALLIAAGCAYAMLRQSKRMLFEGTTFADGGGATAVVMAEFMVALGSLGVALY
jgi:hypothetical protein